MNTNIHHYGDRNRFARHDRAHAHGWFPNPAARLRDFRKRRKAVRIAKRERAQERKREQQLAGGYLV